MKFEANKEFMGNLSLHYQTIIGKHADYMIILSDAIALKETCFLIKVAEEIWLSNGVSVSTSATLILGKGTYADCLSYFGNASW